MNKQALKLQFNVCREGNKYTFACPEIKMQGTQLRSSKELHEIMDDIVRPHLKAYLNAFQGFKMQCCMLEISNDNNAGSSAKIICTVKPR